MKKILAVLLLGIAPFVYAESVTLTLENDVLFHNDFYYTHGTRLTYDDGDITYSLGQNMYTSRNKYTLRPEKGDRPYAGWTYVGTAIDRSFYKWTQEIEFDLGVVGPASYAAQTQRFIHESLGIDVPAGWDTQVDNEIALALFSRTSRLFGEEEFGVIPYFESCLGNVLIYFGIGARFQIGYRIDETLDNQIALKTIKKDSWESKKWQFYLFTGANCRYVIHNIFLEGSMFDDYEYAVHRVPLVADFELGTSIHYRKFRLDFARNFRTKEFETEPFNKKGFDSVKLSFLF